MSFWTLNMLNPRVDRVIDEMLSMYEQSSQLQLISSYL